MDRLNPTFPTWEVEAQIIRLLPQNQLPERIVILGQSTLVGCSPISKKDAQATNTKQPPPPQSEGA